MSIKAIVMDHKDNVATLLSDVEKDVVVVVTSACGDVINEVKAINHIPFIHKIAIKKIGMHKVVLKYGEVFGEAIKDIKKGEHVHIHNVKSLRVQTKSKNNIG